MAVAAAVSSLLPGKAYRASHVSHPLASGSTEFWQMEPGAAPTIFGLSDAPAKLSIARETAAEKKINASKIRGLNMFEEVSWFLPICR
jgi:hypothetical protein